MSTVLVVDDKELMRDSVAATLTRAGMTVITASSGEAAVELAAKRRPDAIVTDLRMPGMTGIDLLEQVRLIDEDLPVVMMTAFGAVETAVQAVKLGAFDYLTKPFEGDELVVAVKRAIEHARLVRQNAVLKRSGENGGSAEGMGLPPGPAGRRGIDRIIGDSPAIRRVKEQVLAVAESHGTVLIYGESGSGKEIVARAVHDLSPRHSEAYLAVNCAALSESLLESELFGHEKGAFTGAEKLRKGRFELADRGTLVLDEISEVSPRVQAKLLRVLQERTLERVGSSLSIGVDVRVVATSNRDLPRAVGRGEFRQDLFFRLNVLPIHLPPLADRLDDVPLLSQYFLGNVSEREGRPAKRFDDEALSVLMSYSWPGNVRELQNICERAAVLSRDPVIGRSLIESWLTTPAALGAPPPAATPGAGAMIEAKSLGGLVASHRLSGQATDFVAVHDRPLEDIERDAIVRTLGRFNGHRQKAAKALGIGVRTLGLKLKKWKSLNLVEQTL
ncbi:MAG: sigma-54-dependent Fis family transcriptional regulator [Phycisphaeraceae bacterium]|nr:sigma-54-dependent Fis family transcriptional regulator [Phycisphaeraceae bacterium]